MSNVSEEMEVNDAALDNPIYSKKQPGEHTDLTDQGSGQSLSYCVEHVVIHCSLKYFVCVRVKHVYSVWDITSYREAVW